MQADLRRSVFAGRRRGMGKAMGRMKLFNKGAIALSALLCLIPLIGAAIVWGDLPDPIAVMYDNAGAPTRWMARPLAVIGLPLAMCAWSIIIARLGYWRADRGESSTFLYAVMWISPMISIALSAYIVVGAIASSPQLSAFGFLAVGVLIFAAGFTLLSLRANTKFGIRTPWSLLTRENWERTNRIGGLCFMLAGIVISAIGIAIMFRTISSQAATIAILITAFLAVIIPMVSSYLTRNAR